MDLYINGSDTLLFINNILIEEAIQVTYNTSENRMPIYGYNKTEFGRVANGQVITTGSLEINHVNQGHFSSFLKGIRSGNITSASRKTYKVNSQRMHNMIKTMAELETFEHNGSLYSAKSIDRAIDVYCGALLGEQTSEGLEVLFNTMVIEITDAANSAPLGPNGDPYNYDYLINFLKRLELEIKLGQKFTPKYLFDRMRSYLSHPNAWHILIYLDPISPLKPTNQAPINPAKVLENQEMKQAMKSAFWNLPMEISENSADVEEPASMPGAVDIEVRYYDSEAIETKKPSKTIIKNAHFQGTGSQDTILSSANKTWSLSFFAQSVDYS
jgi:hypothetical protein